MLSSTLHKLRTENHPFVDFQQVAGEIHQQQHDRKPNYMIPIPPSDGPSDPFGHLGLDLSESELRETAYEIFIGACRIPAGDRPVSYVSQSGRTHERSPSLPLLQRSLTLTAHSTLQRSLGISYLMKNKGSGSVSEPITPTKENRPAKICEMMRVQMKISKQVDSRVKPALLKITAELLGRRIESIVLPVELLQQFKSSDFSTQHEYEEWQRRNLKFLEVGLLIHPKIPLKNQDSSAQQLSQIIKHAYECPMVTGKHSEEVKTLRSVVKQLASRSLDSNYSDMCHWADGVPLNLRLYQILLESLFDIDEPTIIIDEVDDILEFVKRTWGILGLDQRFHNLCFLWVLFNRYVSTGEIADGLLVAADNLLLEVIGDADSGLDSGYFKILNSTLILILDWAERGLLAYRESFYRGNIDMMSSVLSIGLSAASIVVEGGSRKCYDVASTKVDTYIRSSMRKAFNQEIETQRLSRKSSKRQQTLLLNQLPTLCVIAQDITDLAFTEKEIYSPILQKWHPLAVGVAVVTLHSCFGQEVKAFMSGICELTPNVIQVLIAADSLEKCLVQMAVEDSFNSEDGGKSIIQEMTPYEAEGVIADLVKSWIQTRVDRLTEWVDRNLRKEVWNAMVNRGRFAPSAVEVLKTIDETLEAFFLLPIPMHSALLPGLLTGLDRCVQDYIFKAKSGAGTRSTFIPKLPSLTRCSGGSKLNGVFNNEDHSQMDQKRKTSTSDDLYGIPQLCVRVNTFHYIRKTLEVLEKRVIAHLRSTGSTHEGSFVNGCTTSFELAFSTCKESIHELCEITAYKLVFHELNHVFWDGLYIGEPSSSRIKPFLQELEQNLEIISETIQDDIVRTRVITDIMKASFDGFLWVLLAGGPLRNFTLQDSSIIQEDFKLLTDLFRSNVLEDLIGRFSTTVKGILPLFTTETEKLVEKFKPLVLDNDGSGLTLPPSSTKWGPDEPDTLLRVLCHRNDEVASKFLKNNFNLP